MSANDRNLDFRMADSLQLSKMSNLYRPYLKMAFDGTVPFAGKRKKNLQFTEPWWLSGLMCQSIINQCSRSMVQTQVHPFLNLVFSNFKVVVFGQD